VFYRIQATILKLELGDEFPLPDSKGRLEKFNAVLDQVEVSIKLFSFITDDEAK
jgi:hypothetical protein